MPLVLTLKEGDSYTHVDSNGAETRVTVQHVSDGGRRRMRLVFDGPGRIKRLRQWRNGAEVDGEDFPGKWVIS